MEDTASSFAPIIESINGAATWVIPIIGAAIAVAVMVGVGKLGIRFVKGL